jgi:hypothetical protein
MLLAATVVISDAYRAIVESRMTRQVDSLTAEISGMKDIIVSMSGGVIVLTDIGGTCYNPDTAQCGSTPYHTADGSFINTATINNDRWLAMSQDLLWFNGGPFHYGDTVYIVSTNPEYRRSKWTKDYMNKIEGIWVIHDAMGKDSRKCVDLLCMPGWLTGRYYDLVVIKLGKKKIRKT